MNAVLVVDDDRDFREVVSVALEAEGFKAVGVENGREALTLLEADANSFCLVLLDLRMPVMTGRELLAELRSRELLQPPVVVLSAATDYEEAIELGAQHALRKPVALDALLEVVNSACRAPGCDPEVGSVLRV